MQMKHILVLLVLALMATFMSPPAAFADEPPSAPQLLAPSNNSKSLTSTVTFDWAPSSDDVGIAKYELYFDGRRLATTPSSVTHFTASDLPDTFLRPWRVVAHDTAGNRTPSQQHYLIINADPPKVVTLPIAEFTGGQLDRDGTIAGRINYRYESVGADRGLVRHWFSRNGGVWTPFDRKGGSGTDIPDFYTSMIPRSSYRFKAQIADQDGLWSTQVAGNTHSVVPVQDTSSAVAFSGSWRKTSATAAYGGSYKSTTAAKASAKLIFTGRAVAYVAPVLADAGKIDIYVDGVWIGAPEASWSPAGHRQMIWFTQWNAVSKHTIKIVNRGARLRPRMALDAFMIMK